jgi:hypothetical protein
MFNLILLFIDIILFVLSFIKEDKDIDLKIIPKFSKYALMCGLLALVVMIIVSFGYA